MNKQFLKSIRDSMPESLKYVIVPLFRNRLIKNENFRAYYKLLEKREILSSDRIKEYQFTQLKQILIHSYQNVSYYHDLFNEASFNPYKFSDFDQMTKIPFLTREIIGENFDRLISTKKVKNGYYIGATGGSTGTPLKFLLDYNSIFKENAFIYYYRKKLGYNFNDRVISFRQPVCVDKLWKFNPMHNELLFYPARVSKATIEKFAAKLNKFKPQYLNGYISAIWFFTKLLEEYNIILSFKIKGIFLISENLDNEQRIFIEQFFNVRSLTFYGHSERCVIAEEMNQNRYRFDPYYGYTEQIHIEENKNAIVGTGFLNQTMPFIRYKTDDVCYPGNEDFSIEGKRNSKIGLTGINDEFLPISIIDLEDMIFKNITNYQFIQTEKGKADLLIIVNKDFNMSEMAAVKNEMNRQTRNIIELRIKIVENMVLSPRGKFERYILRFGDTE